MWFRNQYQGGYIFKPFKCLKNISVKYVEYKWKFPIWSRKNKIGIQMNHNKTIRNDITAEWYETRAATSTNGFTCLIHFPFNEVIRKRDVDEKNKKTWLNLLLSCLRFLDEMCFRGGHFWWHCNSSIAWKQVGCWQWRNWFIHPDCWWRTIRRLDGDWDVRQCLSKYRLLNSDWECSTLISNTM